MDQATQQNAALVEESAAAADSLTQQARQLVDAVAVFKLAGRASATGYGVAAAGAPVGTPSPRATPRAAPAAASKPTPARASRAATPAPAKALAVTPTPAATIARPTSASTDDWVSF